MSAATRRWSVPLVEVYRGDAVESVHYGAVAVVDLDGRVVVSAGDPERLIFTRSALKPLQALPLVAGGGIERFALSPSQVALLCASHSGEPRHVEAVADMLKRADLSPQALQCGVHPPYYYEATGKRAPDVPYSPLQHNCSGKHAGMLAYCRLCSLPIDSYLAYDHPLQSAIRAAVAHMTGVAEESLVAGIDGCSALNYAVPLSRLAYAYARLAAGDVDAFYGRSPATLAQAMIAHPEMVSGEGRSDLALMRVGGGDWVTKAGAEGVHAIGIKSRGLGLAIKVADGNARAVIPAMVAVLDQLGLLDGEQRSALAPRRNPVLDNIRQIRVGRIAPVVRLTAAS